MKCHNTKEMLDPFIENSLSVQDTRSVLRHLKSCAECRDELEVRLLIHMASGASYIYDAFDLKKSLGRLLSQRRKRVMFHRVLILCGWFFLASALAVFLFFYRKGGF